MFNWVDICFWIGKMQLLAFAILVITKSAAEELIRVQQTDMLRAVVIWGTFKHPFLFGLSLSGAE